MFASAQSRRRVHLLALIPLLAVLTLSGAGQARKVKVRLAVGSKPGNLVYLHIDLAMATDPTTTRLLLSGDASILVDLTDRDETGLIFNGPYQFTGLLTRPDVIRDRPAVAQSMVNAMVKTARFIRGHSAADIAAKLPGTLVGDRYIYVKSLEHSRPSFARDAMLTPAAVANNIQSQLTFGLELAESSRDPGLFLNDRFIRAAAR